MATTASYIPIVGSSRIVSFRNNGEGGSDAIPVAEDQTVGRPGKMRVAFRLIQSDTQNADDAILSLVIQRPLSAGPLDDEGDAVDESLYTPILHLTQSGAGNPADTHPRIVALDVETEEDEAGTIGVRLYFEPSAEPGSAIYDVSIDFSHSIAS